MCIIASATIYTQCTRVRRTSEASATTVAIMCTVDCLGAAPQQNELSCSPVGLPPHEHEEATVGGFVVFKDAASKLAAGIRATNSSCVSGQPGPKSAARLALPAGASAARLTPEAPAPEQARSRRQPTPPPRFTFRSTPRHRGLVWVLYLLWMIPPGLVVLDSVPCSPPIPAAEPSGWHVARWEPRARSP